MTTELVAVIFALCAQGSNVNKNEEFKVSCFEDYVNCMVKDGGKIDMKDLDKCTKLVNDGTIQKRYSK